MTSARAFWGAIVALGFFGLGCAPGLRVDEAVGPVPERPMGRLVVLTPLKRLDPYDQYSVRAPYALYDANGRRLQTVATADYRPQAVYLSPGDYVVEASTPRYGRADVRVRIAPGRTTEVFLDGSWPATDTANPALVQAGNGAVIGWRAGP